MGQWRMAGRRWALLGVSSLAVVAGSAAFACTNLATVNLSSSMGKPGDAITVTGSGFLANVDEMPMDGMADMGSGISSTMGNMAVRSPVVLRWNGPDGPILSSAIPDRTGTIAVIFNIPETQSGQYVILAVQKNSHGYDVYGTPARAPLQVVGVSPRRGDSVRGSGPEGAGGQSTSPGILALTVGLGIAGAGLLAAGGVAATRTARVRRGAPVKVDGRTD